MSSERGNGVPIHLGLQLVYLGPWSDRRKIKTKEMNKGHTGIRPLNELEKQGSGYFPHTTYHLF